MHAAFMFLLNRFTANLNFNALKLKPKFQTRAIRLTAASEWTVPALLAASLRSTGQSAFADLHVH